MKKLVAVLIGSALVLSMASSAFAAKPKKVHETISATLAPFPNLSSHTGTAEPGCTAGVDGVHKVSQEFTSPGKGTLRFWMDGFTGDHDLYVLDDAGVAIARSDQAQVPDGAPPEEEVLLPMTKGQTITLIACNWFGQPDVLAHYEGSFK